MTTFTGMPRALAFLSELAANNNRPWFQDNKARYHSDVVEPALDLIDTLQAPLQALEPEIVCDPRTNGAGSIFRIYRDTRFARDKTPYKTHLGIFMWHGGRDRKVENPGLYLHLEPGASFITVGIGSWAPDQLRNWRSALDHPRAGPKFDAIVKRARTAGFSFPTPHHKRVPRGYASDHPREYFLRCSSFAVTRQADDALVGSKKLATTMLSHFRKTQPALDWMVRHVQARDQAGDPA